MEIERVRFTVHAVERFIERCAPNTSQRDALRLLQAAVPTAQQIDTHGASEVWLPTTLPCKLVIRRTHRSVRCVTVLGADEVFEPPQDRGAIASAYHYINHRADCGDPNAARVLARLHAAGIQFSAEPM